MKLFQCQGCGQLVYFENERCERCGHRLGYIAPAFEVSALEPAGDETWEALAQPRQHFRFCENAKLGACNWLLPDDSTDRYCAACRHNRTVPDLSDQGNVLAWRKMEVAKHRLIYSLMRLGLPLLNRHDDLENGLAFDFLADPAAQGGPQVMTGHDEGLITLALTEADDAVREQRRHAMHEPYRTLLGHFRHEVGHYYWDRLVRDGGNLEACRTMFGDDKADYQAALKRHYQEEPPAGWQENYVSAYATTHAWEDFAETWAHYLHIVDSLETASAFGVEAHPGTERASPPGLPDSYAPGNFARLVDAWLPLTVGMNAMNRSMGLPDLYPFVISPPVIRKLSFIHELVHRPRAAVEEGGVEA